MTFEEFLESESAQGPMDYLWKLKLAKCWNAALDEAADKHSYPMAQLIATRAVAIDELEDLKVKIS